MNLSFLFFKLICWLKNIISLKILTAILSSFGTLWLIVSISTYFIGDTSVTVTAIKDSWKFFLFIGFIIAIIMVKPKFSIGCKLNNRDIYIEIIIGDFFKQKGALVISSNTTFDTQISKQLIAEKSIQGQFTKKFYGDEAQLDKDISYGLQTTQFQTLKGKRIGKNKIYPIGTTVRLNHKDVTAYVIAIANINEHGVASGSFENLREALAYLWLFISNRGLKENIVIPVIGSGFTRLPKSRVEIIREIIKSFIAACSESTFCDKLTIVINPDDVEKHNINMYELEQYISHVCKYTVFSNNSEMIGQQV